MRGNRIFAAVLALTTAAFLSACGGGFSLPTTTTTTPPTGPQATSIILVADTNQLPSNAGSVANGVNLTATALDANNNVLPNVTISFAADHNGVVTVTQATTDNSGEALAVLTTPSDKSNRIIDVAAFSGAVQAQAQIAVVGTSLVLTGPPALANGQAATYIATLQDAAGNGISGQTISLSKTVSGNSLSESSGATDILGQVSFQFTATASDTISAAGLGLTATESVSVSPDTLQLTSADGASIAISTLHTLTITWSETGASTVGRCVNVTASRGTVSGGNIAFNIVKLADDGNGNGTGTVSIESDNPGGTVIQASTITTATAGCTVSPVALSTIADATFNATIPQTVVVQASPFTISTNSQSIVTATVRDVNNNLVPNQTVDFTLNDSTLGSLSAPSAVTNSLGTATVAFNSSSTSSSFQGETVSATVESGSSLISGSTNISVGGLALRIVFGAGNTLVVPSITLFDQPYTVIVTDSTGNPAPNAQLSLSVIPVSYGKGSYKISNSQWVINQATYSGCPNEDVNYNGIIDAGEDVNEDGILEPGNAAEITPVPPATTITLDPVTATANFYVQYPQDHGNWVTVRLIAQATVAGSQSTESTTFVLPVLSADVNNTSTSMPGDPSPYGTHNCTYDEFTGVQH